MTPLRPDSESMPGAHPPRPLPIVVFVTVAVAIPNLVSDLSIVQAKSGFGVGIGVIFVMGAVLAKLTTVHLVPRDERGSFQLATTLGFFVPTFYLVYRVRSALVFAADQAFLDNSTLPLSATITSTVLLSIVAFAVVFFASRMDLPVVEKCNPTLRRTSIGATALLLLAVGVHFVRKTSSPSLERFLRDIQASTVTLPPPGELRSALVQSAGRRGFGQPTQLHLTPGAWTNRSTPIHDVVAHQMCEAEGCILDIASTPQEPYHSRVAGFYPLQSWYAPAMVTKDPVEDHIVVKTGGKVFRFAKSDKSTELLHEIRVPSSRLLSATAPPGIHRFLTIAASLTCVLILVMARFWERRRAALLHGAVQGTLKRDGWIQLEGDRTLRVDDAQALEPGPFVVLQSKLGTPYRDHARASHEHLMPGYLSEILAEFTLKRAHLAAVALIVAAFSMAFTLAAASVGMFTGARPAREVWPPSDAVQTPHYPIQTAPYPPILDASGISPIGHLWFESVLDLPFYPDINGDGIEDLLVELVGVAPGVSGPETFRYFGMVDGAKLTLLWVAEHPTAYGFGRFAATHDRLVSVSGREVELTDARSGKVLPAFQLTEEGRTVCVVSAADPYVWVETESGKGIRAHVFSGELEAGQIPPLCKRAERYTPSERPTDFDLSFNHNSQSNRVEITAQRGGNRLFRIQTECQFVNEIQFVHVSRDRVLIEHHNHAEVHSLSRRNRLGNIWAY